VGWELLLVLVALIALAGCQGISAASKQTTITPPPAPPNNTVLPMGSHPIEPANWNFECIHWSDDCGLNGSWVPTKSQPGTVRLWQSGTEWGPLSTGDKQLRLGLFGHPQLESRQLCSSLARKRSARFASAPTSGALAASAYEMSRMALARHNGHETTGTVIIPIVI
jgi:hypothetical protein